jgi:protein phosphatase 2C family protein 2/3
VYSNNKKHSRPSPKSPIIPNLKLSTIVTSSKPPKPLPDQPQQVSESPKRKNAAVKKAKKNTQNSYDSANANEDAISHNLDPTRRSTQESGIIRAYAVNTNEGLVRNYNEDRVSIILNIMQSGKGDDVNWPKAAFFGIYDGHCGSNCSEFLRDNLHKYILRDENFPNDPVEALKAGFEKAEAEFLRTCLTPDGRNLRDKSGSCALVLLFVRDRCYIANLGDSRAVMSLDGGTKTIDLSNDHKPCEEGEKNRILRAGGKIYKTQVHTISLEASNPACANPDLAKHDDFKEKEEIVNGPFRCFPGRLSVSRTVGDYEAKVTKWGGNPRVIVAEPEIREFKINDDCDFIVMGSDGVYDRMNSEEIVSSIWKDAKNDRAKLTESGPHDMSANLVEKLIQETFKRKAWDNITVILVCFNNFIELIKKIDGQNINICDTIDINEISEEDEDSVDQIENKNPNQMMPAPIESQNEASYKVRKSKTQCIGSHSLQDNVQRAGTHKFNTGGLSPIQELTNQVKREFCQNSQTKKTEVGYITDKSFNEKVLSGKSYNEKAMQEGCYNENTYIDKN